MPPPRPIGAAGRALSVAPVPGLLAGLYLLGLLLASLRRRPRPPEGPGRRSFRVLVPAHDEEPILPATLASLRALDYPADRVEVVVIADNCGDRTADVARAAGATVLERTDPAAAGKGQALAWALDRLPADADAVLVVDADCAVSPNLLRAFDRELAAGAEVLQASYRAANAEASETAALRAAALLLFNHVRPLGKDRLGLSAGLLGTGMCFSGAVLAAHPWRAFSYAEDREYHLELVGAGHRVGFVEDAWVESPMPTTDADAASQQARWDSGRLGLAARQAPRLLARGLRHGEPAAIDAAVDPLVPPQALLAGLNLTGLAAAAAARRRAPRVAALAAVAAQSAFVIGGLLRMRAPAAAWRGLLGTPRFVARRIGRLAQLAAGRGPTRWVRTARPERSGS